MKFSFLGQAFRGPSRGPAELKDEKHVSEFDHECLNKYRHTAPGQRSVLSIFSLSQVPYVNRREDLNYDHAFQGQFELVDRTGDPAC